MIKLIDIINELEINKPNQINMLKVGQIYKITYREDIYDEKDITTDNLKILDKWTDSHGPCVTAIPITEEDNPDDFQLFLWEENIVKVEPYNINELHVNNPNATREEVEYFWRHNIALTTNYRKLKIKYVDEYMDDSRFVPDTEFLIQSLPQHALNKFYRDLKKLYKQQQYKEDPNNLAESMNRFVEMNEIGQILLDKFPQHQNKIQEYIKTIEIEPENYEYLTYHHLLDDFKNFVSLNELEINKHFQFDSNIMKEINMYFNEYFIQWLEKHVTNIDEDIWQYLPEYYDNIKNIMYNDDQFDHDQFDDDMAEEYFNLNMLKDVKNKLWKKYFENVNISKIKKDIYQYIKKYNYTIYDIDEGIKSFFRWDNNFDDMYAPIIVEPFIEEVLEEVISNYDHGDRINELEINKPEPNSNLFYKLNKNKTEVWNTLLKKRYGDLVLSYYDNFNPETDIKFELGDWSGEKEANVVYLNFSEFEIGWEASIDEKYFNINDDEIIDIKEFNIKGLKFYYITYDV